MSQPVQTLRRLTKDDIVKVFPQMGNLFVYMFPFSNRPFALKKLIGEKESAVYGYITKLMTAISKLPKSTSPERYLPVLTISKDQATIFNRNLNQFQNSWQQFLQNPTTQRSLSIAVLMNDIFQDFREFTSLYRTLYNFRMERSIHDQSAYSSFRHDDIVTAENEAGEENIVMEPSQTLATASNAANLSVNSTVYPGIYTQKCYDPVMYNTVSLDKSGAVLYVTDNTKITNVYCLDSDSLKGYFGDNSAVYYQCKPEVKPGALMIRPENVYLKKIRRIPLDYNIFVYENDAQKIKLGKQYVLSPTNAAVGRIASHNVIMGGSVVSAEHCQNNYDKTLLYSIKELGPIPEISKEELNRILLEEEHAAEAAKKSEANSIAATAKAKANANANANATGGRRNGGTRRKLRRARNKTRTKFI